MGIRQNICLVRDNRELGRASPIAWKKTGVISESTAGIKLSSIIRNATAPIEKTSSLLENTPKSCVGISSKQATPANINAILMITQSVTIFFTSFIVLLRDCIA